MRKYKYNKKAGALNEAALPVQRQSVPSEGLPSLNDDIDDFAQMVQQEQAFDSYVDAHSTGVHDMRALRGLVGEAGTHAQTAGHGPTRRERLAQSGGGPQSSRDHFSSTGREGVFFYTVEESQQVLVIHGGGKMEVVEGPAKVFRLGKRIRLMEHHVAHPGEFLIVRHRDGSQEHQPGPAHLWVDPRVHQAVSKEDCIQLSEKEAVVVYSKEGGNEVSRRIVYGPKDFVPQPGEWLHTFSWHGSAGGAEGYRKIPNALVFQKLWLLPDQMYHDIPDVRTSDGVVITIRLMLFFELVDIETMLVTTHDPIGDFANAATSDVVESIGKIDFESFKDATAKLNDLSTYRQLVSRAESCGYEIKKVVYRGYGAPAALQKMHEQAMEARTRLQLEKATEEQAQKLADFQLERRHARQSHEAEAQARQQAHELELKRERERQGLESAKEQKTFEREQARLDEEQRRAEKQAQELQFAEQLERLGKLDVDLTQYLTQNRADRVLEVRGGEGTHLHLRED